MRRGIARTTLVLLVSGTVCAFALSAQQRPVGIKQLREMVESVGDEDREAKIREIYEKHAKPLRERLKKANYVEGRVGPRTKVFTFKKTPQRDLKIYVDYPPDWKATDRRPAMVLWYGGGYTQGDAGAFFSQCEYFSRRGMVCARPEYRVADIDDALPHLAIEDAVSAMRWFKARAAEFGIDANKVVAGGGSAGGSQAAAVGTIDARKLAAQGYVGREEDQRISPRPAAMILYNPFVDFFEPRNDRQVAEQTILLGFDPKPLIPLYHLLSAIEHVGKDTPPNVIMFGTKDGFYPQQVRWIVKCRQMGVNVKDYVYKGEVHSWYNNSPHLEYTTRNADEFLVSLGILKPEPKVELPRKEANPQRKKIQDELYRNKKDWDETAEFREYVRKHNITIIPYKHWEQKK